jgi:hypothetical protein
MHTDMRPIMLILAVFDSLILLGSILAHKRSNRIFKLFFFALAVVATAILILLIGYFIRIIFFPSPPL